MEVNTVCSTFSSGVRLAFVSLFWLVGSAIAHSAPLTATVTTNRGCGPTAVFNIGDPITQVVTVSQDARVTLLLYRPDGTVSIRLYNQLVRGGIPLSLSGVIGLPTGTRRLVLDAAAGFERAHAECTYTAQGATAPLTVTLETNKGCGAAAVFAIGEANSLRYRVSRNALVTLRLRYPNGVVRTLLQNQPVPGGMLQSIPGVIGNPPGQRLLILDAVAGTETAHAECIYTGQGSSTPLTLQLGINKGCGGQYHPGDPFIVTYGASANTSLTLIYRRFDGTQFAIFTNRPVVGGQTSTYRATIGNGMGGRTLILQTSPPTPGVQATCDFTIVP
jgi:hypothetical protein